MATNCVSDQSHWHQLVIDYQPLVFSFAPRYVHLMEWDELVSAGNLGLVKYAQRYVKAVPKYAFATGARLYIRSSMVDAIREKFGRTGQKPKMLHYQGGVFDDADDDFLWTHPVSSDNVEDDIVKDFVTSLLRTAIESLPLEQRTIIERFYFERETLGSIADYLELPDSKIRLLHREAIARLRGTLETAGLTSFPWEFEGQGQDSPIPKAVYTGRPLDVA